MRFLLHKWYLDCVDAAGEAAIVYAAELRWGPLRTGYGALLHALPGAPAVVVHNWQYEPPRLGLALHWQSQGLGAAGTWHAPMETPEHLLADGILWRCRQPGGPASLRLPGGRNLSGRGYADELRLEVPPWRLPFRELRWGRFVPADGGPAFAWIRWGEGLERQWVFLDGRLVEPQENADAGRRLGGQEFHHQPERILREGPLLREVFGPLARLWLGRLRRAHESKALARGFLANGRTAHAGWVIHERVRLA